MKLAELFASIRDMDPRSMNIIERIAYYTCNAHAVFEEARETLDPMEIAQAEQVLHEMLQLLEKAHQTIEAPEQLAILQEAEEMIKTDYQAYQ
ncbi:MAG: hypothetical protein PHE82_03570 [Syntrophomonadaceae bacterium]|nr:hypothetical protein [Syntrophomonadaceae bacterium]